MSCTGQEENQKSFQNSIAISGSFGLKDLGPIRRLGITYERALKNEWNLNVSALIDGSQSSWYAGDIIFNDSIITTSDWRVENSNQMIKLGVKKNLFDFLYLGADLNIGFCTRTSRKRESQLIYNSEYDEWRYGTMGLIDPSQTYEGILYRYTALGINRYLNYGMSLKIGTQLSVNERCKLIIQYSPEYIWRAPFNKNLSSISTFRHFTDLILRFRF